MANDCLVTKLKSAVSGDLPKFGELRLKLTPGSYAKYQANPGHLRIEGSTFSVNEDYIIIDNKYSLTQISSYQDVGFYISVEDIRYSPLTRLNISLANDSLSGDVKNLPSTIQYFCWIRTTPYELKDLGHITSINNIAPVLAMYNVHDQIYGSIEDFVAAQRAAGRTVCDGITFGNSSYELNTAITYQGVALENVPSKRLTWDANGVITLTDL